MPNLNDVSGYISNYEIIKNQSRYDGTTGLGKCDLNGEVTVLQGAKLHCGIQFGTAKV